MPRAMAAVPGTRLELTARPGVSYSLRALHPGCAPRPLFALADVVEDPDGRWLSACFYADAVTDPEELGNTVPLGLLGEDGHCFDIDGTDSSMVAYVQGRIVEAHAAA